MSDWVTGKNADVVTAWSTVGLLVVGVVAAWVALRQLRMIGQDSRDRTRPYVQLDVVPGLQGPGSWDLIIENSGASSALQVVVNAGTFAPLDEDDHIAPVVGGYLLTPKTLVPGARRRIMWGFELKDRGLRAGVLEPREATVTYTDDRKVRGRWGKRSSYTSTVTLGDAFGPAVFPAPTEGPKPDNDNMLAHIDRALRTLNTHVGELRR